MAPQIKNADAYGFPLRRLGGQEVVPDVAPGVLVIACDRLLEPIIGAPCGGSAEDARAAVLRPGAPLFERFEASPRTVISIDR